MTAPRPKDGLDAPVPPKALRIRVGGSPSLEVFLAMGRKMSQSISKLVSPFERMRILDFGCGCARILRHLAPFCPTAEWHGVDIDEEAIVWCRENLSQLACWENCGEWPPLAHGDGSFDLIYHVSVFTHMPEDMQLAWLGEMHRLLVDRGRVLVTVYNETANTLLSGAQRRELEDAGICYFYDGGTPGLPSCYQSCFHTRKYILEVWSKEFVVEGCVEGAFWGLDAIILRKYPKPQPIKQKRTE